LYTSWALENCSVLIKACGGHGYSEYSGIPFHYKENLANTILEGENSILLLQVARFLLKSMEHVLKGEPD
jgi:acyl-CoA oxidase